MTGKDISLENTAADVGYFSRLRKCIRKNKATYMFLVPGVVLVFIFMYIPLMGLSIAFFDYDVLKGFNSPFVGFDNFINIFKIGEFSKAILNTVKLSALNILIGFPLPIIFALMLNELKNGFFKRGVQTVSYLPHFLSTIAVVGLATTICSYYGIINDLRVVLTGDENARGLILNKQGLFVPMLVTLTTWQSLGWNSIIYLSAISGVDGELFDAAVVDGAGKLRQCIHITLPSIAPTIILLFILQIGNLFTSNFDLIYGLQNVYIDFEVISTVVYKKGIEAGNYAMSTALSLTQGFMSLVLVLGTNYISKKIDDVSII